MKRNQERTPWVALDKYRGLYFYGAWPTVPQMLAITAARFAERKFLSAYRVEKPFFMSYGETKTAVDALAVKLIKLGLAKGDKAVVVGGNSPEWAIAYLAVMSAGLIIVPIDAALSFNRAELLIEKVKAKVLFYDKGAQDAGYGPQAAKHVFSLTAGQPHYILDQLNSEYANGRPDFPEIHEEDIGAILFTSGTTGNEKGVMLSHRALSSDVYLSQGLMALYPTDVFYALLPMHHAYCMTAVFLMSMSIGAELAFARSMAVSDMLEDLKQTKVTMLLGIPLLFNKLLQGIFRQARKKGLLVYALLRFLMALCGFLKNFFGGSPGKKLFAALLKKASLNHVRICISGGGPLAPATFSRLNQLGLDFVQGYGLTETGPMITLNPVWRYKTHSVGRVYPMADIIILNADNKGVGEIAVKGPMVFDGYFDNPEATMAAFTNEGYFKTGDLGWKDRENYVYIAGRQKNLIVTEGGKNVYPEEVEDGFQLYSEVNQIIVRSYLKNKERQSEGIEAVIYPDPEAFAGQTDEQRNARLMLIVMEANRNLEFYQRVSRIRLVKEPMPVTSAKKVRRHLVKPDVGEIIWG